MNMADLISLQKHKQNARGMRSWSIAPAPAKHSKPAKDKLSKADRDRINEVKYNLTYAEDGDLW